MSRVMTVRLLPVRALVVELVDYFGNYTANINSLSFAPASCHSWLEFW